MSSLTQLLLALLPLISATAPTTTEDFRWLAGRWEGHLTSLPLAVAEVNFSAPNAYESRFKQAMRLTSHSAERDVFENTEPYDKELMSTQPRTTTYIRQAADTFIGRSNIIDGDGKPAVVEVTYTRLR
ncbi:MAG: hypothetical protein ABJE10_16415 [bacterium]